MAKLLIAHNYHHWLDAHSVRESKPYPPLGTLTLATELARLGHEVSFWDATFQERPDQFAHAVTAHRPEKILLVADHHAVPQKMCLADQREAAFSMIRCAGKTPIVVSGPDVSDQPELYLAAGATAAVRGESDLPLLAWANGTPLSELSGVMRPGDARCDPAPPREIAGLPVPRWDWIDLPYYARVWREQHGIWEAPVSSARGCPYRCNWCAKPIWGRGLSLRTVEEVVTDARELGARGADQIWFTDDIFGLKPAWIRAFREEVERRGGIPPYRCLSRVDLLVRGRLLDNLAATGCREIWVGAESGSQTILDAMDKDCTVEQIHDATRRARARGIRMGFFLQLGYPGEGMEQLYSTISMVRTLLPDEIGISISYPLPGTPFHEAVKDRLIQPNWESAMDCRLLYESDLPEEAYRAAREVIRHEHALLHGISALGRLLSGRSRSRDLRRIAAIPKHALKLPGLHRRLGTSSPREP